LLRQFEVTTQERLDVLQAIAAQGSQFRDGVKQTLDVKRASVLEPSTRVPPLDVVLPNVW